MAKANQLTTNTPAFELPDFIQAINNDYKAQISHVFILHGNIYDFTDNAGSSSNIRGVLAAAYDDNVNLANTGAAAISSLESGYNITTLKSIKVRVMAFFNISEGLIFPNDTSKELWRQCHKAILGQSIDDDMPGWDKPRTAGQFVACMNRWFDVSKKMKKHNEDQTQASKLTKELILTIVVTDADAFVPKGEIASLSDDRNPIVAVRNWSKNGTIGDRNRIILMTRHLTDIHDSIRTELSVSHLVRKPNLEDRHQWLKNFDLRQQADAAKNLTPFGKVNYSEDFDARQFAIQSAGMNRQQLKDVIFKSWMTETPIDFTEVRIRKQRALQDEYAGMLDFREPEFGFEQIGGHDHFKEYCQQKIIQPLKDGDTKRCSRGVLLTGPPGTGKSFISWALASEAKMNYLEVDLGKVFGGLVGETESNMRRLLEAIEAASPCIVFIDEIESVLSSGRQSQGDSGTSARVFNSFMTWMSDPSRTGKVVVIAATNRPDMLDAALIRPGRFDTKIAILPPSKNDPKGRLEVLKALKRKHKISFEENLSKMLTGDAGLGKLLNDKKRIWTGAEMEVLVKKALDKAAFSNRQLDGKRDLSIHETDWDKAMNAIIPNTGEIDHQIKLALYYVDDLDYVPDGFRTEAADKIALKQALKAYED